jgi:hypothetical protein
MADYPVSGLDPFSEAYLADPHPAQEALREAGPVVRLTHYNVWAVARYQEVYAGLSDFKKEKPWRLPSLVLETDPPLHDRTRKVLDNVLSPAAMRGLRASFAAAADRLIDELLERGSFDAVTELAEAYPLEVFPDAVGMPRENRRHLLPYGNMVFNSFGPRNEFFEQAVSEAEPVLAWVQAQSQRDALSPDGFGAAVHAAADAGILTAEEAPMVVRSILTAGVAVTPAMWALATASITALARCWPGWKVTASSARSRAKSRRSKSLGPSTGGSITRCADLPNFQ